MSNSPAGDERTATRGIECPSCGCRHFYVVYTRRRNDRIIRRKACRHCGRRVLTIEKLAGTAD